MNNIGLLLLRVSAGAMMLLHGIAKLIHGVGFIEGMLVSMGLPAFLAWGVYVGEVIAPLMLIVGYRTKIGGAVMAFNCLVAMLMVHSSNLFALGEHGGLANELLFLYFFASLALLFTGGGKYAVSNKNKWD
ncbi:MAG: DoxX family protein [Bacteroidales bacterium]